MIENRVICLPVAEDAKCKPYNLPHQSHMWVWKKVSKKEFLTCPHDSKVIKKYHFYKNKTLTDKINQQYIMALQFNRREKKSFHPIFFLIYQKHGALNLIRM